MKLKKKTLYTAWACFRNNIKVRSFASSENIQRGLYGSYCTMTGNESSSVTLHVTLISHFEINPLPCFQTLRLKINQFQTEYGCWDPFTIFDGTDYTGQTLLASCNSEGSVKGQEVFSTGNSLFVNFHQKDGVNSAYVDGKPHYEGFVLHWTTGKSLIKKADSLKLNILQQMNKSKGESQLHESAHAKQCFELLILLPRVLPFLAHYCKSYTSVHFLGTYIAESM